jgi:hypothetical protein
MKKILVFTLSFTFSFFLSGQSSFQLIQSTQATDLTASKRYGFEVAASDSVIVFGAYLTTFNAGISGQILRSGSAHILERDSTGWIETQEVFASFPTVDDRFGFAAAVDNQTVIIGAPEEDQDENDIYRVNNAGSVYIFTKDSLGNWVQSQKLVASDRSVGASFGNHLQLNGNQLIVGAMTESVSGPNNAGAAYVFVRDTLTGLFHEFQKLTPSNHQAGAQFGARVSIDDNYVVVGAGWEDVSAGTLHQDAGAAYVFAKGRDGKYHETKRFVSPVPEAYQYFGICVFIKGKQLAIGCYGEKTDSLGLNPLTGAGAVFYYEPNSGNQWVLKQKLTSFDRQGGDFFGHSLSMENNYMVITAFNEDSDIQGNNIINNTGSAYTFRMDNQGHWSPMQKLTADSINRTSDAKLGYACAMHKDMIILGAPLQTAVDSNQYKLQGGRAYIFETNCLSFTTQNEEACGEYTWIDGIKYTNSNPDPTFILTGSNNCDSIVHLELHLLADTTVNYSDTLLMAADTTADQYQWINCNNGNSPIPGATSPAFTPTANGSYALIITEKGCSDTSKCYAVRTLSIPEVEPIRFRIYPNPGNGAFTISCSHPHNYIDIQISDATGQVIHSSNREKASEYTLQTSHWANGVYIVSITLDNTSVQQSIWIKQ